MYYKKIIFTLLAIPQKSVKHISFRNNGKFGNSYVCVNKGKKNKIPPITLINDTKSFLKSIILFPFPISTFKLFSINGNLFFFKPISQPPLPCCHFNSTKFEPNEASRIRKEPTPKNTRYLNPSQSFCWPVGKFSRKMTSFQFVSEIEREEKKYFCAIASGVWLIAWLNLNRLGWPKRGKGGGDKWRHESRLFSCLVFFEFVRINKGLINFGF